MFVILIREVLPVFASCLQYLETHPAALTMVPIDAAKPAHGSLDTTKTELTQPRAVISHPIRCVRKRHPPM